MRLTILTLVKNQKNNLVIFRCNAGPQVGFGHLVRCRALALALKEQGANCIMVGPEEIYCKENDSLTFSEWISRNNWSTAEEDAIWLAGLAREKRARMLVLDDYRVDGDYQLVLKNKKLRWLQFARPNQYLWANFVLNPSPGADVDEFKPYLCNPAARLLLGPRYAVLRPEFVHMSSCLPEGHTQKILVTFGSGDDRGAIQFVLESLVPNTPATVTYLVIVGKHNPRNQKLMEWIKTYGQNRVDLKINPPHIARLFASCNLAVMAGGTTTYEVSCLGLPMILVAIAENQIRHSIAWEKIKAAKYIGTFKNINSDDLICSINEYIKPGAKKHCIPKVVDGLGSTRVAESILLKSI